MRPVLARLSLLATLASAAGLHMAAGVPTNMRRCPQPRAAESDDFDLGLLKLPRLVRPAEAALERFRQRRREWSGGKRTDVPVGPTDEPIPHGVGDDAQGTPTPRQKAQANAEFEDLLGLSADDGFSQSIGDDVDDLLRP